MEALEFENKLLKQRQGEEENVLMLPKDAHVMFLLKLLSKVVEPLDQAITTFYKLQNELLSKKKDTSQRNGAKARDKKVTQGNLLLENIKQSKGAFGSGHHNFL